MSGLCGTRLKPYAFVCARALTRACLCLFVRVCVCCACVERVSESVELASWHGAWWQPCTLVVANTSRQGSERTTDATSARWSCVSVLSVNRTFLFVPRALSSMLRLELQTYFNIYVGCSFRSPSRPASGPRPDGPRARQGRSRTSPSQTLSRGSECCG